MKELFILINDKFASAACGSWTASEPHDGTFHSMRRAVRKLEDACPDSHVSRISFAELEYDPVDHFQ